MGTATIPRSFPIPRNGWISTNRAAEPRPGLHRRAGVSLQNKNVHAIMHVVIENQVAMGDELPVRRAIDRLVGEGLDRHEAIHAMGSALAARRAAE